MTTRRVYELTLMALAEDLGGDVDVATITRRRWGTQEVPLSGFLVDKRLSASSTRS